MLLLLPFCILLCTILTVPAVAAVAARLGYVAAALCLCAAMVVSVVALVEWGLYGMIPFVQSAVVVLWHQLREDPLSCRLPGGR